MSQQSPAAASCDDDFDPGSLDPEQARARILAAVPRPAQSEEVPLKSALGRVLAQDLRSPIDVPPHTNSAVDGYAFRHQDLADQGEGLRLSGEAFAGRPYRGSIAARQAVRIMTGAVLPAGCDTVAMQEHVERSGDRVRVRSDYRAGQNVRAAGEDLRAGEVALAAGQLLMPMDLGLIASLGIGTIHCWRRLRVAYFSTGDELRSIGEPLAPGDIHDSNRYTLHGMLRRMELEPVDLGVVRDDPALIRAALLDAAGRADAVLTSGGVSVGEADYIKDILQAIGRIGFWKVAMKPGRPLAFGNIGQAVFFGLPGNPVSVMVTFYQFVRPALLRMQGAAAEPPLRVAVPCASRLNKKPGRTEYQRGVLTRDAQGRLTVYKTGDQGSGILSSMARANCFIVLPVDCARVEPGSTVEVEPFYGIV